MATIIGCSSSPFRYFQLNTNPKLRFSQFVSKQSVAHQTISEEDKSFGHITGLLPKLRARLQKPQTLQRAPKDIFPIGNSCFHISGNDGKPILSFCNRAFRKDDEVISADSQRTRNTRSWFIGPAVLVASFCFPLICLPEIFVRIFGETVLKVVLLSFSQEAIFYCGVAIFLILLDRLMRPKQLVPYATNSDNLIVQFGEENFFSLTAMMAAQLSMTIPIFTMSITWPWSCYVIPVVLVPYLVGILVESAFERLALYWNSPSWAAIPFIFHVYRLNQIHKAAHMLTFIVFKLAEAEKLYSNLPLTPTTWERLMKTLQFLLMLWIWSFSSFLVKFLSFASSSSSSSSSSTKQ